MPTRIILDCDPGIDDALAIAFAHGHPGIELAGITTVAGNIALAVKREPRLADWVRGFVIMGGSAGRGNVTPAAEYNIWADPEAAAAVFRAGWTVTMLGLDVTLQTGATEAVLRRMSELGPLGSGLLLPALEQYRSVSEPGGPPVHDVCAVAWVAEPDLFGLVPARVQVEVAGQFTA